MVEDKEDAEDSTEDVEEDDEERSSTDELFSGVETVDQDSDTGNSEIPADKRAAEVSQIAGEQVNWNKLIENLEDVANLIHEYFEQSRENKRVENEGRLNYFKHQQRIIFIAAGTFIIVIGISAWMTFHNALSGDAFTFVLGTLFGAILTFLQNMIGQNESEE